jgi:3-hydroxyacyl-CoA dehydrogenase
VVKSNSGASLIDLGDGIGCIELHSLKNAIGGDVLSMISAVLKPDSEAVANFAGFVISSDRENFSVGANLMQLLLAAQEGEWDEVAAVIHGLPADDGGHQVLPAAGGGRAVWPHAGRRRGDLPACGATPAARRAYIGLVEAGVGLIPAGGGTKEMLLRAVDQAAPSRLPIPKIRLRALPQSAEMAAALKRVFETIALAKVPLPLPKRVRWGCWRHPTASP